MSAEGMARVIREHWAVSTDTGHEPFVDKCVGCGAVILTWGGEGDSYGVDTRSLLAEHQADALAAAGYGSMHDAWAEGHGASDEAWETPRDICNPPPDTTNPYPETK